MANGLAVTLKDALIDFLSPLQQAASDSTALRVWLQTLGHTAIISGDPALLQIASEAASLSQQISSFDPETLESFAGIKAILALGQKIAALQSELTQFSKDPVREQVAEGLSEEILALLLATFIRRRYPIAFRTACVLTLIDARETGALTPAIVQNGVAIRYPALVDSFNFDNVGGLLSHPAEVLKAAYFPNQLASGEDAWTAAARIFPNLSFLADEVGLAWSIGYQPSVPDPPSNADPYPGFDGTADGTSNDGTADGDYGWIENVDDVADDGTDDGTSDNDQDDSVEGDSSDKSDSDAEDGAPLPPTYYSSYFPSFRFDVLSSDSDPGDTVAIEVQCSSSQHPGATPGYMVSVVGTFNSVTTFAFCRLTLTAAGQIPAFVLQPTGLALVHTSVPIAGGAAKLLLERLPDPSAPGPAFLLGSADGTRLEVGLASLELDLSFNPSNIVGVLSLKLTKCALVIRAGDGDSFLSSVLPTKGLNAAFDFGLSFSNDGKLSISGGAGLTATLPVGLSLCGVLTIPTIYLGLIGSDLGIQAEVSSTIGLFIGPVQAMVSRLGVLCGITFPADGGNLGPLDLSLDFKSPSGVGLSIDSVGVTGGGGLLFDSAKHEYSGVLQLQFNGMALQAFGMITTQVAGGSGYSLLALVDASFPPVQLGWGFTLNGVGGLLAVHRIADTDKLRAALKADKLSSVLFPKSSISNAPLVLAQLDALFPTAPGRFLFGPMALIGWGTPTILTIALAVILEEPEPVRILLLARLAALLPSASAPLVKINMDALGVLDLSQSQLALDATLYDSKVMGFALSGDMSLRADWGSQRAFLLAIGGFHPQFTPPAGFPTLQRVTIDMPSRSISKLRLSAYIALTSNTVQFGANLDVFIGISGFGLSGHLGFDALLQIAPFHFTADISGSVSLKIDGDDFMSVGLDASLDGPAPWHIAGSFKISFFFFSIHKSFSITWGESTPALPIPPVDVLQLLQGEFGKSGNWGISLPSNAPTLVSLRTSDGSTLIAHPLALLNVHQRLVPLDLQIKRFGAATISGATKLSITEFSIGGSSVGTTTVQDDFAPAQFFDLTDAEKLAGPSFEPHDAGVSMAALAAKSSTPVQVKTITYETFYIDDTGGQVRRDSGQKQTLVFTSVKSNVNFGASGSAVLWKAGNRRYAAPGKQVRVNAQSFIIATKLTLQSANLEPAAGTTYSDARALLEGKLAAQASLKAQLQIVGTHEMAAV